MIRRSQKEQQGLHAERASLAKRIAQALPARNLSNRNASDNEFVPETPAPTVNTAVARLGDMAIHFATKKLREAGINGVSLYPKSVTVLDQTKGMRISEIRRATITLKSTFSASDGKRVATKHFACNLSFANGSYSLDSLQVGKKILAVHKDVMRQAGFDESTTEDEGVPQEAPQSIPNGTKVRFDLRGMSAQEFGQGDEESSINASLDGEVGTVKVLATATEMGEKDYEYYDVEFSNGETLHAVSGYHLTPLTRNAKRKAQFEDSEGYHGSENYAHEPQGEHDNSHSASSDPAVRELSREEMDAYGWAPGFQPDDKAWLVGNIMIVFDAEQNQFQLSDKADDHAIAYGSFDTMEQAVKEAKRQNGEGREGQKGKVDKRYELTKTRDRGSPITMDGTLAELIEKCSYTLECGASYQHEKGNAKINRNPKTIDQLVRNLNNAVNNAAANGYAGTTYSVSEKSGGEQGAVYMPQREAQKKNPKDPKVDIGKPGTPLADFYKSESPRVANTEPKHSLSVQRLPETDEYRVNYWIGNKRNEELSYYTNDKADAEDTKKEMQKQCDKANSKKEAQSGLAASVVEALKKKGVDKRDIYKESMAHCMDYLGLDKAKAILVSKTVCEQLGAPKRNPQPLAEPKRQMPKGNPLAASESSPEIVESANELTSYLAEAASDLAYSIAQSPSDGGKWAKEIARAKRNRVQDITGWLADEIHDDPETLTDFLGDRVHEYAGDDAAKRNAILMEMDKSAHDGLKKAIQFLLAREGDNRWAQAKDAHAAHECCQCGGYGSVADPDTGNPMGHACYHCRQDGTCTCPTEPEGADYPNPYRGDFSNPGGGDSADYDGDDHEEERMNFDPSLVIPPRKIDHVEPNWKKKQKQDEDDCPF